MNESAPLAFFLKTDGEWSIFGISSDVR